MTTIRLTDREYYAAERKQFPAADHSPLDRKQMVEASRFLFKAFDLPALPIFFSDQPAPGSAVARGNWSWFHHYLGRRDRTQPSHHISYGVLAWQALTVAHEVAHYVRHEAYRRDALLPWFRKPVGPFPKPWKAHDHRHAAVTARAVKLLEAEGYSRPSGLDAIHAAKERYLRRVAEELSAWPIGTLDVLIAPT